MSKASYMAQLLMSGKTLERYKEGGNSMLPLIKSQQPVRVEPITKDTVLNVGDIVFCKVKGNYYTHLISAIRKNEYQISNNRGRINGWVKESNIFGKVTKIHTD